MNENTSGAEHVMVFVCSVMMAAVAAAAAAAASLYGLSHERVPRSWHTFTAIIGIAIAHPGRA